MQHTGRKTGLRPHPGMILSFAALIAFSAAEIQAASPNWQVPSGDWSLPANWQGNLVPAASDSPYIQNGGTATVSQSGEICGTLTLGTTYAKGIVQLSVGDLTVSSNLYVGAYEGSSGAFYVGGMGVLSAPTESIGFSGTGTFNQSGGSNSLSGFLLLGYGSTSSATGRGTYNLSGGLLSADTEYIGSNGIGIVNQTGGTNTVNGNASVSRGYYLLGGGLLAGDLLNGINRGTLLITNGGMQSAGGTLDCSGFAGISTLSGALLDLSGNVVNAGSTSLSVASNSLLILPSTSTSAAYASYSNSGLTDILGSTLNISAGTGFGGWGTVPNSVSCSGTITATPGGWINLNSGLALTAPGQVSLGSGTLTVNDTSSSDMTGGTLTANSMVVGLGGTGSFTQSAGASTLNRVLNLGRDSGGSGTYKLSGGSLSATSETIGLAGGGSFTQSGGTHAAGTLLLASSSSSVASYNLSGGLLRASSLFAGSGAAVFNDSGGTFQAAASFSSNVPMVLSAAGSGAVFDTSGNTLTLTAALSGSGSLYKCGTGMLVLSGSDTYSGGTFVAAGTLKILNPASLRDGSNLTVGGGAITAFGGATFVAGSADSGPNAVYAPAAAASAVPEPSTYSLLAAVASALLAFRLMLWRRHSSRSAYGRGVTTNCRHNSSCPLARGI